ncbi:Uncharacterized protein BM_BM17529 [Brugia malayi]|uniref:Uncharacterized protein n=1 Tax=Brugia malayi TaxID=6279 RepID=A0A4E9FE10_BRUMA|nr:Uncharacterized protein BM_BM17529 [Brugia malayi]VIO94546.1 Uncharacterized protein BM_BM17529 [Brugia malayi]
MDMHACRHACGSTHRCACMCTYLFHFQKKFLSWKEGRKEGGLLLPISILKAYFTDIQIQIKRQRAKRLLLCTPYFIYYLSSVNEMISMICLDLIPKGIRLQFYNSNIKISNLLESHRSEQHAKIITEERCRFWRLLNTDGALDDIFSGKTVSGKRSSQLCSA